MWVYQRVSGHLQRSQQITRCWSKKPAMGAHIRSVIWAPCTIGHGRAWLSRYEKQKHAVPDDLWSFRISIGNYTRRNPGILMSGKNQKRARCAEKRAEELVWMLPFRGVFLPFPAKDHITSTKVTAVRRPRSDVTGLSPMWTKVIPPENPKIPHEIWQYDGRCILSRILYLSFISPLNNRARQSWSTM